MQSQRKRGPITTSSNGGCYDLHAYDEKSVETLF